MPTPDKQLEETRQKKRWTRNRKGESRPKFDDTPSMWHGRCGENDQLNSLIQRNNKVEAGRQNPDVTLVYNPL